VPIELSWDDEAETILYVTIILPWDWADFRVAVEEAKTMLVPITDKHGVLVDIREAEKIPPSGFIKHVRQVLQDAPTIPIAIIGDPDIARTILSSIIRIMRTRRKIFFVRTLEEAREAISKSSS
jgi:hypothetical protein